MSKSSFVNVDDFQRDTTLEEAARRCGTTVEVSGSGRNVRIDCPFNCPGDHACKREIAVDTENSAKQWMCHAYQCQTKGNLLNLMYGWLHGQKWDGDKLRGAEFNSVKQVIAGDAPPVRSEHTPAPASTAHTESEDEAKTNLPLRLSEHDSARGLMDPPIWEKLTRSVSEMSPAASAYIRRHPALTSEAMTKWHVGVMPMDGGGDKRGWSLRGSIVYPFGSEDSEIIAFVARDPKYEEKLRDFEKLQPDARDPKRRPMKHRFPKGFHRGIELFGQERSRFENPEALAFTQPNGLIVVEGFNDVIQLDALDVPTVAICSNEVTDEQVDKIARYASDYADRMATLLLDCEAEGDRGAKEAAWKLMQRGVKVRTLWSTAMHGNQYRGQQPENLNSQDVSELLGAGRPST